MWQWDGDPRLHRAFSAREPLDAALDLGDKVGELARHGVADGVRDVDRRRPGGNGGLRRPAEEVGVGAARILGRPLHIVGEAAGEAHAVVNRLQHLLFAHPQDVAQMLGAGGDEGVDTRVVGPFQGLGGALYVAVGGPGEARDLHPAHLAGDGAHGLKVPVGGDREAGLDDIHLELGEHTGDAQLLLHIHGAAGGLLAVAQGGVKDQNAVAVRARSAVRTGGAFFFAARGGGVCGFLAGHGSLLSCHSRSHKAGPRGPVPASFVP